MEELVIVDERQRLAQLVENRPDIGRIRAKELVEGHAVDELHNEKAPTVRHPPIIIDFGEMGMMEGAKDSKLVLEAGKDLGVGGVLGLQHLGGAKYTALAIANFVDGRGTPGSEGGEEFIAVGEEGVCHEG